MKKLAVNYIRLFLGFLIIAAGVCCIVNTNFGCSAWDVLSTGFAQTTGVTLGQASMIIGVFVVAVDFLFKETMGVGTVLNIIFIGLFIDLIMASGIVPVSSNITVRVVQFALGIFLQVNGTILYISASMGAGPRDTWMMMIAKRTGKPIGIVRIMIEIVVVIVGVLMGGQFGAGTVVLSIITGFMLQFFCKILNCDLKKVKHRSILDEVNLIKSVLKLSSSSITEGKSI